MRALREKFTSATASMRSMSKSARCLGLAEMITPDQVRGQTRGLSGRSRAHTPVPQPTAAARKQGGVPDGSAPGGTGVSARPYRATQPLDLYQRRARPARLRLHGRKRLGSQGGDCGAGAQGVPWYARRPMPTRKQAPNQRHYLPRYCLGERRSNIEYGHPQSEPSHKWTSYSVSFQVEPLPASGPVNVPPSVPIPSLNDAAQRALRPRRRHLHRHLHFHRHLHVRRRCLCARALSTLLHDPGTAINHATSLIVKFDRRGGFPFNIAAAIVPIGIRLSRHGRTRNH